MAARGLLAVVLAAAVSNAIAQQPLATPLPAPKGAGPERSDAGDPKLKPEDVPLEVEGEAVRMPTETFSLPPPAPEEKPAPPAKDKPKKKKPAAPSGG